MGASLSNLIQGITSLMSDVTRRSSKPSSYMAHAHPFTITGGFKSVFEISCVQMKRHAMHMYTTIMHNSASSQDKGLISIDAGST